MLARTFLLFLRSQKLVYYNFRYHCTENEYITVYFARNILLLRYCGGVRLSCFLKISDKMSKKATAKTAKKFRDQLHKNENETGQTKKPNYFAESVRFR